MKSRDDKKGNRTDTSHSMVDTNPTVRVNGLKQADYKTDIVKSRL
jgi:hypothetical protein